MGKHVRCDGRETEDNPVLSARVLNVHSSDAGGEGFCGEEQL